MQPVFQYKASELSHLIRLGGSVTTRLDVDDLRDPRSDEYVMTPTHPVFVETKFAQDVHELVEADPVLRSRVE